MTCGTGRRLAAIQASDNLAEPPWLGDEANILDIK
jgi:hypothetical protein